MAGKTMKDILLGLVPGPEFRDGCSHDKKDYVCTFEVYERGGVVRYDLYVYPGDFGDDDVCLRYGNEDSQYISPGAVTNVIANRSLLGYYGRAAQILTTLGTVHWKKKGDSSADA